MKKPEKKQASSKRKPLSADPVLSIIVFVYSVITVVTPNFHTLDSNGPKFLALGLVNLVSLIYLVTRKKPGDDSDAFTGFISHPAGLLYLFLLLISLISFVKAINIPESLMVFSKYFTVFTAALVLFSIFRKGKVYFEQIAVIMTLILIIDGITVFVSIGKYISHEIESIIQIKSVYSNKNILASAVFVKIPFALWLIIYKRSYFRFLGIAGLFIGFLATLFMSTRAFYIGILLLTGVFFIASLIQFIRNRERKIINQVLVFSGMLALTIILFSLTQKFLYPVEKSSGYNSTIGERLSTIESGNHSIQLRLMAWKNSAILVKQNPLLGVGIGNWRVAELKYENPYSPRNNYMLKAHNDFIEVATETGIPGGLAFLGIFLVIFYGFTKSLSRGKNENQWNPYIFASAIGLLCYSVDAFFNFPSDRPEIQVLFAVFLAAGISTDYPARFAIFNNKKISLILKSVILLATIGSVILLTLNFISLRYQRVANDEIGSGRLRTSSAYFINGFPSIPTLTSEGEPISITKSWFLINDGKYREAINMVKNDGSSPYNGNNQYVMAWAYRQIGKQDSMIYYLKEAVRMMPINYDMVARLCDVLGEKNQKKEALKVVQDYLSRVKDNPEAWSKASELSLAMNLYQPASDFVKQGLLYCPGDTVLTKQAAFLDRKIRMQNVQAELDSGLACFQKKQYVKAVEICSRISKKESKIPEVYEVLAKSQYLLKEYREAVKNLNKLEELRPLDGNLLNLRGTSYWYLKDNESACRDFLAASQMGNAEAAGNYKKACSGTNANMH